MQPRSPRVFRAQDIARGVVTVANTGDRPATFGVQVTPGADAPFIGFVSEAAPVGVVTPTPVAAGGSVQVPVFVRLPETSGAKAFLVRVGEVDRSGRITRVLDEQVFGGLAEIAELEMPLPGEAPPAPARPSAQQLALEFRDSLGQPTVTVDPASVQAGQVSRVSLAIPTRAGFPFRPRLSLFLVDAAGRDVRELVSPTEVTAPPGQTIRLGFAVDTGRLPAGSYGARVFALDPETGIVLLDPPDLAGVLTVLSAAAVALPRPRFSVGDRVVLTISEGSFPGTVTEVEEFRDGVWQYRVPLDGGENAPGVPESWLSPGAAAALPEPPAPAPAPGGLFPGDLEILEPLAEPATVEPGQTVRINLFFVNSGPLAPPIDADLFVLGPQGGAVRRLPRMSFTPETGVATMRTVRWVVPETAAAGSYGLRVFAWDPNTFVTGDPATFLLREDVLDVFRVAVPEAAPDVAPAVAEPEPELAAASRGTVAVTSPPRFADPVILRDPASPFTDTSFSMAISNLNPHRVQVDILADLMDENGQVAGEIISITGFFGMMCAQGEPGQLFVCQGSPYNVEADPYTATRVLEPGVYGVRVRIVDSAGPRPAVLVFEEHYPGLLRIERTREPGPVPRLEPGDLFVREVTASARRVRRGEPVRIDVTIENLTDVEGAARVTVDMFDIQAIALNPLPVSLGPKGVALASFRWDVAGNVRTGACAARVQAFDPDRPNVRLATADFTGLVTVI